jgi:arylsulfatase A-like enzyme
MTSSWGRRERRYLGGLLLASIAACSGEAEPDGPDVLLISLDSVRSDYLTFVDEETAPNLTELARRGTIFTQAVSGTSWTLPSHIQMFTGMPPVLHCVQEDDLRLDPLVPTLPQLLARAGYHCAGLYTSWYLSGEYGFADGFFTYRNSLPNGDEMEREVLESLRSGEDLARSRAKHKQSMSRFNQLISSPTVVENAAESIASADSERPYFLFAHLYDPHFDYVPPAPWRDAFDPEYEGKIDGVNYWTNKQIFDETKEPKRRISDRDLDHVRALYRGEVAWTDAAIGDLLAELSERGRLENTLIIITADHGEEFFEHDDRGHRRTLYEEVLRVPLLVVPPGALAGKVATSRDDQVSLSDILPTILDYAGVAIPETVHGRPLRPLIEGREQAPRPELSSLCVTVTDPERGTGKGLFEALRTPEYKLIRSWIQFDDQAPELHAVEYFDLRADPAEVHAITTFEDKRVRVAWRELEAQMETIRRAWGIRAKTPIDELTTEFARIVGSDLQALGYAGGGGSGEGDLHRRLGTVPLPPSPVRSRDKIRRHP